MISCSDHQTFASSKKKQLLYSCKDFSYCKIWPCKVALFLFVIRAEIIFSSLNLLYTQPVWTLFLSKSIWTRPQGSQGCQKIRIYFLQIKVLSSCAKIAQKRHKLRKLSKLKKKCQKPCFLGLF